MGLPGVIRSEIVAVSLAMRRVRAQRLRELDFTPFAAGLAAVTPERRAALEALLVDASIATLQDAMARGELTAVELTVHHLDRIRRFDGALHTVIELDPTALDQARASDERRRAGSTRGLLDGIPVTIKDNIETAGPLRTTAGAMVLADNVASADAPIVRVLREAGAVILAKANLSELAGAVSKTPGVSAVGGETANPHGVAFSPGGSSSGSAAGVAAGLTVVSVGTETSGSLLAPSAFNGVVGMKATHGRVDGAGIVPLVRGQDTAGPIGKTVADAAVVLAVLDGGSGLDPAALSADALQGVTVGVLEQDILAQRTPYEATADNPAMLARIDAGLRAAGAVAVTASVVTPEEYKQLQGAATKVVFGGLANDTMGYLARVGVEATTIDALRRYNLAAASARMPRGQLFVDLACMYGMSAAEYAAAAAEHSATAAKLLDATFAAVSADVLVSITNLHSPLYATAGYPAVTVPLGLRASGMPTGVTFIGRRDADAALVQCAFAFEQATNLRTPPIMGPTLPVTPPG